MFSRHTSTWVTTMQPNTTEQKWIVQLSWIDILTLSSVITTSLAVALILDGYLHAAVATLFIAMTADALDGYLARSYKNESQFGGYLDSFMDVFVYLVVPSLVLYQAGFNGGWGIFLMLMIGAGCLRLSAFNQTGNVQSEAGLAYMGMPVFWSMFICAGYFVVLELGFSALLAKSLLACALTLFSWYMLQRKPFFKFTSLLQMLSLTLAGFALFVVMQFGQFPEVYNVAIIYNAWVMQIPIVFAGVSHMWIVSNNKFSFLNIPVNTYRYGQNKTLRGFVVMPMAAAMGSLLWLCFDDLELTSLHYYPLIGAVMGIAYMVAELPNSYMKRRLGVAAGQLPRKGRGWFLVLDQLDSGIGVGLLLWLAGFCNLIQALVFVVTFPITALVVKSLLYTAGLKKAAC